MSNAAETAKEASASEGSCRNNGAIIEDVLKQTVDFLVHEIEPVLIAEYLKHQRRRRRHGDQQQQQSRSNGGVNGKAKSSTTSPACMSELELRSLLADIILGPCAGDDDIYASSPLVNHGESVSNVTNGIPAAAAAGWSAEDDFWTFCRMLRKLDADRKSGEFLEALGSVLRIVTPCRCKQCGWSAISHAQSSSFG